MAPTTAVADILTLYQGGSPVVQEILVLPTQWTADDYETIGDPTVLGNSATGYVGVLRKHNTMEITWCAPHHVPIFDEARAVIFAEIERRKAPFPSAA